MSFNNSSKISSYSYENTSGQGRNAFVPPEVAKKFNWGAFLLSWIWGLFNKTYITLVVIVISIIPIIGTIIAFLFCIWFGIKGNEWAWQNKSFDNINAFHNTQRKWATAGAICTLIFIIFAITVIVPSIFQETSKFQHKLQSKIEVGQLKEAVINLQEKQKQCKLTSPGLAICFKPRVSAIDRTGNKLRIESGAVWMFEGKNNCSQSGDCSVKIITNEELPNDFILIPLYADTNGLIYVKDEDTNKYLFD